jgi:hypothetical protein
LALGGHQPITIPTNQPIIGRSGRGDVLLEVEGGYHPIVWGNNWNYEKMNKIKYIVALDCCQLMISQSTTNQKHASAMEASVERRLGRVGSHRCCYTTVFVVKSQ